MLPDYLDSRHDTNVSALAQPAPDAPPEYTPMQLQSFYVTRGFFDTTLSVFSSKISLDKYKKWKRLGLGQIGFPDAKQGQNMSIGLPLLVTKKIAGFNDTCLRLYETVPCPNIHGRLYSSDDNRAMGMLSWRVFGKYQRHKIQVRDTQFHAIEHLQLPIIDFQIDRSRFRFVRLAPPSSGKDEFAYDLFLLDPDQSSLLDGMDTSNKMDESNPFLQELFIESHLSSNESASLLYGSPHKIGIFKHLSSSGTFTTTKECSFLSLYTTAGDLNKNSAVEPRSLVFLAVALAIQRIEDVRQLHKRSQ